MNNFLSNFPYCRPRRLRKKEWIRTLVQENSLRVENLIFNKPTILFSQKGNWKIEMENLSKEINFKDTISVPLGVNVNIEINESEVSYLNCVSSI